MPRTKTTQSSWDTGNKRKAAIGIIFILAIGIFFARVLANQSKKVSLDEHGCLPGRPLPSQTLIFVDNTDPFSALQIEQFRSALAIARNRVPSWGMISVATIRNLPVDIIISQCSPDKVRSADDWDTWEHMNESWLQAAADFETNFEQPLSRQLAQMPLNSEAPASPIVQSISGALNFLGPYWDDAKRREIVIFSDLMENTLDYTQYSRQSITDGFTSAVQKHPYLGTRIDLRGADIIIFYETGLLHDRAYQGSKHLQFWQDFFKANGAATIKVFDFPKSRV